MENVAQKTFLCRKETEHINPKRVKVVIIVAKKKEEQTENLSNDDIIIRDITKKFGEGLVTSCKDLIESEQVIASISPALDSITGGIPEGSWVTLSGPSGCGKTVTALTIAQRFLKLGKKKLIIANVEGRLKRRDILGINGLDPSLVEIVQSTENQILSAADILNILSDYMKASKDLVFFIDSYSALAMEKELTDGIGTSTRGGPGLVLAQFTRNNANVVPVKRHVVIGIQQLMANTSGYGSPVQEKGGNAVVFQGDVRLRCKSFYSTPENSDTPTGQAVVWETYKTALHIAPHRKATSFIRYGYGIDSEAEVAEMSVALALIKKAGAWYSYMSGDTEVKKQGMENLVQHFRDNPNEFNMFYSKIKELSS